MEDQPTLLDDLIRRVEGMPDNEYNQMADNFVAMKQGSFWIPTAGPQTEAYFSEADELFYGGSAGGGKTELGLGLALCEHTRGLFLRREREQAVDAFERVEEIIDTSKGRNGQQLRWDHDGHTVKFGGCKNEKDKQKYKGRPYDLYVFDEIGDFLKSQYEFIKTWNRSVVPGQRCRVLCTGNPPTTAEGLWVIEYWGAWLNPKHPNPAKDGELRWYTTDKYGLQREVDGTGPHILEHEDGSKEEVRARSRTFIRAWLTDNPYLNDTEYGATLDALPAEIRAAYRDGRFDLALEDNPKQVIPTSWIIEAQQRWRSVYKGRTPEKVPMCAIGVDIAMGGSDELVLAPRYDGYYPQLKKVPGKDVKKGSDVVAEIVALRRNSALPILDMGGGFGSGVSEKLDDNGIRHSKYKGASGSNAKSKCKIFTFFNKRTEAYWKFREALDPEQPGGSDVALPDDAKLVADLAAPKYEVKRDKNSATMEVRITTKEDVCTALGRSPDAGDAVIMSWTDGDKADSHANIWHGKAGRPQVQMGRRSK